jgi:hypothetical protein
VEISRKVEKTCRCTLNIERKGQRPEDGFCAFSEDIVHEDIEVPVKSSARSGKK